MNPGISSSCTWTRRPWGYGWWNPPLLFLVVCLWLVFWENHWLRGQQWLDSCFGRTVRHIYLYIDLLGEGNFSWMFWNLWYFLNLVHQFRGGQLDRDVKFLCSKILDRWGWIVQIGLYFGMLPFLLRVTTQGCCRSHSIHGLVCLPVYLMIYYRIDRKCMCKYTSPMDSLPSGNPKSNQGVS